jgi:hypothetical protein
MMVVDAMMYVQGSVEACEHLESVVVKLRWRAYDSNSLIKCLMDDTAAFFEDNGRS